MRLLLQGGRVVDPLQGIDETMDILIEGGIICRLGKNISKPARGAGRKSGDPEIVNVSGFVIVPGLIDMHTHLREPGFEYKETIQTGSRAAVAGGFTALACMPNTFPVNDNRSVTELIRRQASLSAAARVYPVAAISMGSKGETLTEFQDLREAGAVAFSDDGKPVMSASLIRRALEYASSLDMPVISHCEDINLSAGGVMNEGLVSTELGLKGIPGTAEDIMVSRDIISAEYSGACVHIAHVTTAGAVELIRNAKRRGVRVTAETAPHYFVLTDEEVRSFDTNTKVNPPLRSALDVAAIKEGLRDGTIDVIACDHAPHAVTDKDVEYDYAACGIIGLETSLGLSMRLVSEGVLSISDLVLKMSANPASILRVQGGSLKAGMGADITIIDTEMKWLVDPKSFHSKSRNTPFDGWNLKGRAVGTIVGGEIKHWMGNK